jgi:beta-1,4-mannosyltransferase
MAPGPSTGGAMSRSRSSGLHFVVVVLGDLGRSPRMMYHVLSLLEQKDTATTNAGHHVTFIGYTGESLIPALLHRRYTDRLHVVRFPAPQLKFLKRYNVLLPLYFTWRIASLTVLLFLALFFKVGTTGAGSTSTRASSSSSQQAGQEAKEAAMSKPRQSKQQSSPSPPPPDCVLVQNPPAIPLLAVAALYCYWNKAGLVIDWHNLGYSMIGNSGVRSSGGSGSGGSGSGSGAGVEVGGNIFRYLGKLYEKAMAPLADGHLTVTTSLKEFLSTEMGIMKRINSGNEEDEDETNQHNISVLHDCPPAIFRLRTLEEQHRILLEMDAAVRAICPASWFLTDDDAVTSGGGGTADGTPLAVNKTLFTEEYAKGRFRPRRGRPALIVSSTSWTPDEDISLLLQALEIVEAQIERQSYTSSSASSDHHHHDEKQQLRIVCVITGKGPLKERYEQEIQTLRANKLMKHVAVTTLWIEPRDYPAYLACADLGVSLHTSTSKLDLPIKILDYFGCEVPVCAFQFSSTLKELVQDDVNGRTFTTSDELAVLLWDLLSPLQDQPQQQPLTRSVLQQQADEILLPGGSNHSGGSVGSARSGGGVGNHDFGALKRYSRQVQGRLLWSENWPKNAWPVLKTVGTKYKTMRNHATTTTTESSQKKEN